jgi:hypothetical protein
MTHGHLLTPLDRPGPKVYVARPGSARSYTRSRKHAHVFTTLEEAERNRCGNERIIPHFVHP